MKVRVIETWPTYSETRTTNQTHFELDMSVIGLCHVNNVSDARIGIQSIVVPAGGTLVLETIDNER